jgi:hypothetical protein
MPTSKGTLHLSSTKLEKYGITAEMYRESREKGLKWCGWHKRFEEPLLFNKGCKLCREGAKERDRELYGKFGNARKHHAPKNHYEDTLLKQDGHCALCSATEGTGLHIRLHIDHDHKCCNKKSSCGKCLRGLLCWECNHQLGRLEELLTQVETIVPAPGTWLEKALGYLKHWQEVHNGTH